MFSKSKPSPETVRCRSQRLQGRNNSVRGSGGHTFSVIASDVEITGNLSAKVDLHIDGKMQRRRHLRFARPGRRQRDQRQGCR